MDLDGAMAFTANVTLRLKKNLCTVVKICQFVRLMAKFFDV